MIHGNVNVRLEATIPLQVFGSDGQMQEVVAVIDTGSFFGWGVPMSELERKQTELITEFDRYIREHPEFAEELPLNAVVCLQLEGDGEYNSWSRQLAHQVAEAGQPIVYVMSRSCAHGSPGLKKSKYRRFPPDLNRPTQHWHTLT